MILCLEGVLQVAVPVRRQTATVFGRVHQSATRGMKSVIYNFLVVIVVIAVMTVAVTLTDEIEIVAATAMTGTAVDGAEVVTANDVVAAEVVIGGGEVTVEAGVEIPTVVVVTEVAIAR